MIQEGQSSGSRRKVCPDCFQCQGCSEERCRVCRKQGHSEAPTLPTGFTYGEYLEWKERRSRPEDPPST
ncbi:MAG: hypothetical protein K9M82_04540 [Deltaproteobacteria bacterium]|nr:hypothetical protein [Deltaproteobacteria bacterium]